MTTRTKAKPVTKSAAPAPVVLNNFYAGQEFTNLYHLGRFASVEGAVKSETFDELVTEECWEGDVLIFLEADDNDNVISHNKYRVQKAGYVVQKP